MNVEMFWSLIEDARQQSEANIEKELELLAQALFPLSLDDIQEFDRILWTMMARAYRADLWEAASLVAFGCTDDGFHDFRDWLIAQGQIIFEKALEDPENLAEIVDKQHRDSIYDGRFTSIAAKVYEQKTGQEIPESGYREKVELERPLASDDESAAKYPRIIAKLGAWWVSDEDFG
jgi:hypothetical protein